MSTSNFSNSSNYFEILSHPVRYSILKVLDINIRNFGEILKEVSVDNDIGSSKLNFHLKKLVDLNIIIKNDKLYSISDLGLKLLTLIENFESLEQQSEIGEEPHPTLDLEKDSEEIDFTESTDIIPTIIFEKNKLPVIKRPPNLSLIFSVFEYFEGKNYEFMEQSFSLSLPNPISLNKKPTEWIKEFSNDLYYLLNKEQSKEWLIDRLLKLGYGTRGLQDYGFMDASLSVPPLQSLFNSILSLLKERGKAGLYAKTGMGKSRIALYLASYWMRSYKSNIIYLQDPHLLEEEDLKSLQKLLLTNIPKERKTPNWLVIIEDAHLANSIQAEYLNKLISGASNRSYSIFVSFTDLQLFDDSTNDNEIYDSFIESLKHELIPNEFSQHLNLEDHWLQLKPYFTEWLKWISADVLIDYLPTPDFKENKNMYQSPWAFVVSLGFLKTSLKDLESSLLNNNFPLILYHALAQIYIMRGERALSLSSLIKMFSTYFNEELLTIFGTEWVNKIKMILSNWTLPSKRLLPPFQYCQNNKSFARDTLINFYHIQWANEVCTYLENTKDHEANDYNQPYEKIFPFLKDIWSGLPDKNSITFTSWLRNHVSFDINDQGEVRLTKLHLKQNQIKKLATFKIPENHFKSLTQDQLVNWLFVKSIIYD